MFLAFGSNVLGNVAQLITWALLNITTEIISKRIIINHDRSVNDSKQKQYAFLACYNLYKVNDERTKV